MSEVATFVDGLTASNVVMGFTDETVVPIGLRLVDRGTKKDLSEDRELDGRAPVFPRDVIINHGRVITKEPYYISPDGGAVDIVSDLVTRGMSETKATEFVEGWYVEARNALPEGRVGKIEAKYVDILAGAVAYLQS